MKLKIWKYETVTPNMCLTAAFFWDTGMQRILTEISMRELCYAKDSTGKVHKELKVLIGQQRWHAKIRYENTPHSRNRMVQISKACKEFRNSDLSAPCSGPLHFNSLIYSSLAQLQLQSSWSNQQVCRSEWTSNWSLELNGTLSGCQKDSLKEIRYYNSRKSINVTRTTGLHFVMSELGVHTARMKGKLQLQLFCVFVSAAKLCQFFPALQSHAEASAKIRAPVARHSPCLREIMGWTAKTSKW